MTARLVVKGPESYDFNETLSETSDLELSSYQLNWSSDSQDNVELEHRKLMMTKLMIKMRHTILLK